MPKDLATTYSEIEILNTLKMIREYRHYYLRKLPIPDINFSSTLNLLDEIFSNKDMAMHFSKIVHESIQKTGFQLGDNETFACMIYVTEKPIFLSDIEDPTPEPADLPTIKKAMDDSGSDRFPIDDLNHKANRRIFARRIMEPAIMRAVLERMDNDKIKY